MSTKEKIKSEAKKLYPVSKKDIKTLLDKEPSHKGELDAVKDLKKTVESGTNSYSSYNKKMISALKKD